jgi:hypothetical protein
MWMTGAGLAGWLGAHTVFGAAAHPEALVGLAGPVASANVSWLAMVKAQAAGSDRLMAVMVRAMAIKMVFFGAYVVGVFGLMAPRPVPFVASFTASFVGLYVIEAVFLKRLIEAGAGNSPAR